MGPCFLSSEMQGIAAVATQAIASIGSDDEFSGKEFYGKAHQRQPAPSLHAFSKVLLVVSGTSSIIES